MAKKVTELTIFQKMLVAPLIGLILYSTFLLYIHGEHKKSIRAVETIRDAYLPVRELANENVILFDAIAVRFKDAVLAGEKEWVLGTKKDKEQIESNLKHIASFASLVNKEHAKKLGATFLMYYDNAFDLSMAMLKKDVSAEKLNRLIENVESLHGQTSSAFGDLKENLKRQLSSQISDTNHRLNSLVLVGVGTGVALMILVTGVTFAMSLSTRKSLSDMNMALQNIANDTPDFSARLNRNSDDELGEMAKWFNILSSKLEKDYKKIEVLSVTDKLTQLYNRVKIEETFNMQLNKANRYGECFSAIILDIDHFKMVNDTHGHQVGDDVLQNIARVLRKNVRNTDFLGRWGGEEFIILSPNTTLEQATQLAEKLRIAIESFPFDVVGQKTVSFGVAAFCDGDTADIITKRADDCLYIAKERGRNIVIAQTAL